MVTSMFHAVVLIKARPAALPELGPTLAALDGVTEAFSVTGEWDFVAVVRLRRHEELAERVAGELAQLTGIERTETMVAFEVFSRHDLESMFSIGAE
jgi:DNA-binding Lrp family transcriptional regulator